jgi:hypothetical protein
LVALLVLLVVPLESVEALGQQGRVLPVLEPPELVLPALGQQVLEPLVLPHLQ